MQREFGVSNVSQLNGAEGHATVRRSLMVLRQRQACTGRTVERSTRRRTVGKEQRMNERPKRPPATRSRRPRKPERWARSFARGFLRRLPSSVHVPEELWDATRRRGCRRKYGIGRAGAAAVVSLPYPARGIAAGLALARRLSAAHTPPKEMRQTGAEVRGALVREKSIPTKKCAPGHALASDMDRGGRRGEGSASQSLVTEGEQRSMPGHPAPGPLSPRILPPLPPHLAVPKVPSTLLIQTIEQCKAMPPTQSTPVKSA
ncbi:unnamed protein product [Gadus morhua 'NCC']